MSLEVDSVEDRFEGVVGKVVGREDHGRHAAGAAVRRRRVKPDRGPL